MKREKGFTMAELLIVVAIVAVLVAIAIPVFSAQLEKSREATDAANIRSAEAQLVSACLGEKGKMFYKIIPIKQKSNDWKINPEFDQYIVDAFDNDGYAVSQIVDLANDNDGDAILCRYTDDGDHAGEIVFAWELTPFLAEVTADGYTPMNVDDLTADN